MLLSDTYEYMTIRTMASMSAASHRAIWRRDFILANRSFLVSTSPPTSEMMHRFTR